MPKTDRDAFTLVEAIIVIVVLAALLAVLIPVMRERECARLQALANVKPWRVFGFTAAPASDAFGERIVVRCAIENLTT